MLHRLVDTGNTVLVIEHHIDVIKQADHIIDLGPLGGDRGGEIVAEGTPEKIARTPGSLTGKYLRDVPGAPPRAGRGGRSSGGVKGAERTTPRYVGGVLSRHDPR